MEGPKEGILHSTEGEKGHGCNDTYINTHIPGDYIVLELPGPFAVIRKYGGRIAVGNGMDNVDGLIQIITNTGLIYP